MPKAPVVSGEDSGGIVGVGAGLGAGAGVGVDAGDGAGLGAGVGVGAGVGADPAHPTINNINSNEEVATIVSSFNCVIWYLLRDVLLHLTLLISSLLLD
ncbi:hypothetical protein ACFLXT_03285 [Chloroflexota bacterium]